MNTVEHPNATAYRRTVDAFRDQDFEAIRSSSQRTSFGTCPAGARWQETLRIDRLVAWLGRLGEFGFTIREHDVFGNDEHVCALSYIGARRPGVDVGSE